jgi:hypothetical protein
MPGTDAPATGHWLYSAETGEIARPEMQARPRGRLGEAARACVARAPTPTP